MIIFICFKWYRCYRVNQLETCILVEDYMKISIISYPIYVTGNERKLMQMNLVCRTKVLLEIYSTFTGCYRNEIKFITATKRPPFRHGKPFSVKLFVINIIFKTILSQHIGAFSLAILVLQVSSIH